MIPNIVTKLHNFDIFKHFCDLFDVYRLLMSTAAWKLKLT